MKRNYQTIDVWKNVSEKEWNDWHWQMANRIITVEDLGRVIELKPEEMEGIKNSLENLRMAITPYYATLMDPDDSNCPIRKQAVPVSLELQDGMYGMEDPLHEDVDSPVPGITHRYPDRVLFLVTDQCSMYCRHCTRRRYAGTNDKQSSKKQIDQGLEYIKQTPAVRDVLLSGGDSLCVSKELLEYLLSNLRQIKHIEIIRIGTRTPVVMPMRITNELCKIIKKYHPVYVNTHFNHPKEVTPEAQEACERLVDAGIPVGNQTVLLKGVNDCPYVIKDLMHRLLKIRIKPYYLYQCDLSPGIEHFRTPVAKGIEIMELLRGHTSGLAVPTYVIDAPGGGGKIPVSPQYMISQSERAVILRNYEGMICAYPEPALQKDNLKEAYESCKRFKDSVPIGIEKLFAGNISLIPKGNVRENRNLHH